MASITRVCFGIQARSTSTRLPGKVLREVAPGRPLLRYVLDSVNSSVQYLNKKTHQHGIMANLAVLCPVGDPAVAYAKTMYPVIEGPEHDVLARYFTLAEKMDSDYFVRITADCQRLPPRVMSSIVLHAVNHRYDFASNAFETVRTAIDGHDVEIMSKRALEWAHKTATDPSEREHVTLIFKGSARPDWLQTLCIMHPTDESTVKYSIDTEEELDRFSDERRRYRDKYRLAEQMFGKDHVFRV